MRDAGEPAIRASALSKSYGPFWVLREIDLEVPRGECLAVLGANGAGKTTLLRLLSGVSRASRGKLRMLGGDCYPGRAEPQLLAKIGLVSHEPLVYRDLTPRQNLEFFARLYRLDRRDGGTTGQAERIKKALARFELGRVADRPTRALSRGMLQKLAVARATLHEPELLLLDEPFTSLDASGRESLSAALTEIRARGATIVLVTHDLDEIASLASRVLVLNGGRAAADLTPVPPLAELDRVYRGLSAEKPNVGHRS